MFDNRDRPSPHAVQAGLWVSLISVGWTVVAGLGAITIGAVGNSLVLIAFGATGLLDALGSGTLIVHFRHALRHEAMSEHRERVALRVVTLGMAAIAVATIADSSFRLASPSTSRPIPLGVFLAGASVFVLAFLARQKQRIAARIPSPALHADGWLSATGAALALFALLGTGLEAGLGWWWLDPIASIGVAGGAGALSVVLARE